MDCSVAVGDQFEGSLQCTPGVAETRALFMAKSDWEVSCACMNPIHSRRLLAMTRTGGSSTGAAPMNWKKPRRKVYSVK
jgi:hypothetical protein